MQPLLVRLFHPLHQQRRLLQQMGVTQVPIQFRRLIVGGLKHSSRHLRDQATKGHLRHQTLHHRPRNKFRQTLTSMFPCIGLGLPKFREA